MGNDLLVDQYGRNLNYLRLSVTDRCNFRCYYCMPEKGMNFMPRKSLLSFEEMLELAAIFCTLGITKIRITGGEPFVRPGIIPFFQSLSKLPGLEEITITTNGTLITNHLQALQEMGIRKINISLDSLNKQRFFETTRRDEFDKVYASVFSLLDSGFTVKLNCVVAAGKNTEDIIPFIELTRNHALQVRFLEEMPFNGSQEFDLLNWNHRDIYRHIQNNFPEIEQTESEANSTSVNYKIRGYKGSFGIIPSFSRTFCGTCNRVRLSATGELRTCLYGAPAENLRDLLRNGIKAEKLKEKILLAVSNRKVDGFAAEAANQVHESMSVLGG